MNYDNGQIRGHVPRMPGNDYGPRPVPSGYPAHALPGNSVRYAGYQQQPPPPMGYIQRGYAYPHQHHVGPGSNPNPGENGVGNRNFANSQPPPGPHAAQQQFYQGPQPQQVYYQQQPPPQPQEYVQQQQFPPGAAVGAPPPYHSNPSLAPVNPGPRLQQPGFQQQQPSHPGTYFILVCQFF